MNFEIDFENTEWEELRNVIPKNASTTMVCNGNRVLVISYDTEILEVSASGNGYFDEDKYSKTTTRLQNRIREFLEEKGVKL